MFKDYFNSYFCNEGKHTNNLQIGALKMIVLFQNLIDHLLLSLSRKQQVCRNCGVTDDFTLIERINSTGNFTSVAMASCSIRIAWGGEYLYIVFEERRQISKNKFCPSTITKGKVQSTLARSANTISLTRLQIETCMLPAHRFLSLLVALYSRQRVHNPQLKEEPLPQ